jgi:DNA-binding transcriptional regulator GbsR (MarR family)
MFEIYAIVLKNSKGVTYKDIDNKVKIGIVSVSHYCCRLRKMNFVELRHEKS